MPQQLERKAPVDVGFFPRVSMPFLSYLPVDGWKHPQVGGVMRQDGTDGRNDMGSSAAFGWMVGFFHG